MKCLCIKDCLYYGSHGETIFKKGFQYVYKYEDDLFIWVIYNINGDFNHIGRRFYDIKPRPPFKLESFHNYFIKLDRKKKLIKLNNIKK